MKSMFIKLEAAVRKKDITPISNTQPCISHLIYADDVILFAIANDKNAYTIRHITQQMVVAMGLYINEIKTRVYFSTSCQNKSSILQILQLQESQFSVKYLGVPLSSNYLHYPKCNNLFQKIMNKIDTWDSKLLSMEEKQS